MKWVYKYDENFIYLPGEEIQVREDAEIPEFFTEIKPPDGLYLAKLDLEKGIWFESATKEYIDSLKPPPPQPSELDKLKKQVSDLMFKLLTGGVIK
ncbi:hypothetical protein ACFVIX_22845 [Bacillus subtilis]|uniref:Uncharacterized protein n=1 Tax=Bacillus subtilis TaxID=1423 RepID=A0AAQ3ER02_BACIU|nr:hypothetical protein [Bacillus subtilis]KIN37964.1 hypothetical protein B4071_2800 [Bacillus subtilis]WHM19886.1 hypothetical protein QL281_13285 [Bacillus subtilis]WHM22870.1 hypothetical protein QL281_07515 [Bacillus subtilis]